AITSRQQGWSGSGRSELCGFTLQIPIPAHFFAGEPKTTSALITSESVPCTAETAFSNVCSVFIVIFFPGRGNSVIEPRFNVTSDKIVSFQIIADSGTPEQNSGSNN
ncbi:MAG: hypothetical protein KDD04_10295, partial [Sinomicrobium sp.]|nr:hypothetical protein [Sinomicrobium sp.]